MANIAIIQFPGSNCERETLSAVERVGMQATEFLWFTQKPIEDFDGYIIVGGFSYEDRGRAGFVAAQAPLIDKLAEQGEAGKPILGICNGAQILVESGLVPGINNRQLGMALTTNKRVKNERVLSVGYYNTWCNIKPKYYQPQGVFGRYFSRPINIPLAHADGRFVMPREVYNQLELEGACLWQYCDFNGVVDGSFPINPNGSMENLAGISNPAGNILALMPHPERAILGDIIMESIRDYIEEQQYVTPRTLSIDLSLPEPEEYACPEDSVEIIIEQLGLDNEAMTMEKALRQQGYPYQVKRYDHWQIQSRYQFNELLSLLDETYELINHSKERLVTNIHGPNSHSWLVRDKSNIKGLHKMNVLHEQYNLYGIEAMRYGVIWQIVGNYKELNQHFRQLTRQNFFFNPFAHEYYAYQ